VWKMRIYDDKDTIAAVATPPGQGGIAVVRISGSQSADVLSRVFKTKQPLKSHMMRYGRFVDGTVTVDEGMAVFFASPHSYTGEDSAELYCHGSYITTQAVLTAALNGGARMAQPGEFTRRAFMNGRIDLSQAEAVADLIGARSASGAKIALSQLSGRLRNSISSIINTLIRSEAEVAVTVDYPEDDIEDATSQRVTGLIKTVMEELDALLRHASAGRIYREGVRCAILGQPNVGKSSLLNALLGEDRAIVTDEAGTTRDSLEAEIDIGGLNLILIDTAGIRSAQSLPEQLGVQRAQRSADTAQLIFFILDATRPVTLEELELYRQYKHIPHIVLINKQDVDAARHFVLPGEYLDAPQAEISALTGQGIEQLEALILGLLTDGFGAGEAVLSNVRHIDAVRRARAAVARAADTLSAGYPPDLVTLDLREARSYLASVTGQGVDEDLIDNIFSRFCVGK